MTRDAHDVAALDAETCGCQNACRGDLARRGSTLLEFIDKMVYHLFELGAVNGEDLLKVPNLLEEILRENVERALGGSACVPWSDREVIPLRDPRRLGPIPTIVQMRQGEYIQIESGKEGRRKEKNCSQQAGKRRGECVHRWTETRASVCRQTGFTVLDRRIQLDGTMVATSINISLRLLQFTLAL